MTLVREFARSHRLDVTIETSHPTLLNHWASRVIGGRALPPFPGANRDCATDYKVAPMRKLRNRALRLLQAKSGNNLEPVVLLGTRYAESSARSANMRERGESDVQVRRGIDESGKPSHLFLSPIAHWSTDDVWEYLGLCRAKTIDAYSDFDETFRVYADAMGSSCVIVGEDMSTRQASKACGARHGCALCTLTGSGDRSMENMLTQDRYAYMRGLNQLRNFLANTRWDLSRRSWLGRTIQDGYVRIAPDAYSPAMMQELLRYTLTIDQREREAAMRAGIRPRFQLVDVRHLFAIDAMWSLQGFHRPFHALKIYDDIVHRGERFDVPDLREFPRVPMPPARYMAVGPGWDEGARRSYTGLRSALAEMVKREGDGCMGTHVLKDGREVMDISTGELFDIDVEAAYFVLDELPELLRRYHDAPDTHSTEAYMYYARLGMLSVRSGMQGEVDDILRRTNFKQRNGIAGEVDLASILERSVSAQQAGFAGPQRRARERGAPASRSSLHEYLGDGPSPAREEPIDRPRMESQR
jgi:3'-phosphoadenosine 5'-phosphosulfate sulfotransferase (PAPS reductase)/FAD synthetase